MKSFYAVTVDTEEEWNWNSGWPTGTPGVTNIGALERFQSTCDKHGAAVTYFANHAVMTDSQARDALMSLADNWRVEIGMHVHPWNTPPLMGSGPVTARESFLANLPVEIIQQKLQTVYDSFVAAGLRPTSFRGGRYSSGADVQSFLQSNGFLADSSVVPFTAWSDEGSPDYRHRNLEPKRLPPAKDRTGPLWEIPLSLGFTRRPFEFWSRVFYQIQTSWLRRLRIIGLADRLNVVRRAWLNFEDPLGEHMPQFLHRLRSMQLSCLVFTIHSSSLQVGANGCYTNSEQDRERLYSRIDNALRIISKWPEFQPVTLTEVAQRLEENYHACSRN